MIKNPFPSDLNREKRTFYPFLQIDSSYADPKRMSEDARVLDTTYKVSPYGTALQTSQAQTLQEAHDLLIIGLDNEWQNTARSPEYQFSERHRSTVFQPHVSLYDLSGPLVVEEFVHLRLYNCAPSQLTLKKGAYVELHACDLSSLGVITGSEACFLLCQSCTTQNHWKVQQFSQSRLVFQETDVDFLQFQENRQTDIRIYGRVLREREFFTRNFDCFLTLQELKIQQSGDLITKNTDCSFVFEETENKGSGFNLFAGNAASQITLEDSQFADYNWIVFGESNCDIFQVGCSFVSLFGFQIAQGTNSAFQSNHLVKDCLFTTDNGQVGVTECEAISLNIAPLNNSSIQFTDNLLTGGISVVDGKQSNIVIQGGITKATTDSILLGLSNYAHFRDTTIMAPLHVVRGLNTIVKARNCQIDTGDTNFQLDASGVVLEASTVVSGADNVTGHEMLHVLMAQSQFQAGGNNFNFTGVEWFESHQSDLQAGDHNLLSVGFGDGHVTGSIFTSGAPSIELRGEGLGYFQALGTVFTKEILFDNMERVFLGKIEALFLKFTKSTIHVKHSLFRLYIEGEGYGHYFDNIVDGHVTLEGYHNLRQLINPVFVDVSGTGQLYDVQTDKITALGNWTFMDLFRPKEVLLDGTGRYFNVKPADLVDIVGVGVGHHIETNLINVKGSVYLSASPSKILRVEGNSHTYKSIQDLIAITSGTLNAVQCNPAEIKVLGNLQVVDSDPGVIDVTGTAASQNANPGSFIVQGCIQGANSAPGIFKIQGAGGMQKCSNVDWTGAGGISESDALKFKGASNGYASVIAFLEGAGSLDSVTGGMSDGVFGARKSAVGPYIVAEYELGGAANFIHLDYPEVRIRGALTFGAH